MPIIIIVRKSFLRFCMDNDYDTKLGNDVLNYLVELAKIQFNEQLIACYALGSLAHGGFSQYVSDIDFAMILKDPLDDAAYSTGIKKIRDVLQTSDLPLAQQASLFYATIDTLNESTDRIRFPAYDRLDLLIHGKLLYGTDIRENIVKPTQKEICTEGIHAYLNNFSVEDVIHQINNIESLVKKNEIHKVSKIVLLPARFIYTAKINKPSLAHNANTVNYFDNHSEDPEETKVIIWAYQLRHSPPDKVNDSILKQYESIRNIKRTLFLLYKKFFKIYYDKLYEYNEIILALKFKQALIKLDHQVNY